MTCRPFAAALLLATSLAAAAVPPAGSARAQGAEDPAAAPEASEAEMETRRALAAQLFERTRMDAQILRALEAGFMPALEARVRGVAQRQGKRVNPEALTALRESVARREPAVLDKVRPQLIETYAQALTADNLRWLNALYADPEAVALMGRVAMLNGRILPLVQDAMADDQGRIELPMPPDLLID